MMAPATPYMANIYLLLTIVLSAILQGRACTLLGPIMLQGWVGFLNRDIGVGEPGIEIRMREFDVGTQASTFDFC